MSASYSYDTNEQALAERVADRLEWAFREHELTHGYFVDELRSEAINNATHAVLDTVYGERCIGCGYRGPSTCHGPGVCV
jgi:hypothetical protein